MMKYYNYRLVILLTAVFMIASCEKDRIKTGATGSPPGGAEVGAPGSNGNGSLALKDYKDMSVPISWEADVLPFLSSNKPGAVFRCTVCHTEYKNPETLLQAGEVDRIIQALRSSGSQFMPRAGNRVPDAYIVMLKRWQRQSLGAVVVQK